jgi:hypothetical protein
MTCLRFSGRREAQAVTQIALTGDGNRAKHPSKLKNGSKAD